jgi:hypothetical protein
MHSASTTVASLPDWVTMPCSRCSTLYSPLTSRNEVDPCECHWRQVSGRTGHFLSSGSSPLSTRAKATWVVIILAMEAGGMRRSASFSNSTAPEDRSTI